jgi:hypothetical protein
VRINYSGEKRRRELAAKQKKEEKAQKLAERRALKAQYPDGIPPELMPQEEVQDSEETEESGNGDDSRA